MGPREPRLRVREHPRLLLVVDNLLGTLLGALFGMCVVSGTLGSFFAMRRSASDLAGTYSA
jgi:hypothetical protein